MFPEIKEKIAQFIIPIIFVLLCIISTAIAVTSLKTFDELSGLKKAWLNYEQVAVASSEQLDGINRQLGYGGFIHHFEMLMFKYNKSLIPQIYHHLDLFEDEITAYMQLGISSDEKASLQQLNRTVQIYRGKFELAQHILSQSKKIDSKQLEYDLKVDDSLAITALNQLHKANQQRREQMRGAIELRLQTTKQLLVWLTIAIVLMLLFISMLVRYILCLSKTTTENVQAQQDSNQVAQSEPDVAKDVSVKSISAPTQQDSNGVFVEFAKEAMIRTVTQDQVIIGATPHYDGLRVLLVEDNTIHQQIELNLLSSVGAEIDVANNGVEAIQKLGKQRLYDIILMDLQMPEMDGFKTTEYIRFNCPYYSEVPIIAVTANAMETDKEKCLQIGMNDYISKPIEVNSLYNILEKWLGVKLYEQKQVVEKNANVIQGNSENSFEFNKKSTQEMNYKLLQWQLVQLRILLLNCDLRAEDLFNNICSQLSDLLDKSITDLILLDITDRNYKPAQQKIDQHIIPILAKLKKRELFNG